MRFAEFWESYFEPQGIGPMDEVTRIEWRYLDEPAPSGYRVESETQ